MPGKKLTARKRAELKQKKRKQMKKKSNFPILLIFFIIIIGGIAGGYYILTNTGSTENGQNSNGQIGDNIAPVAGEDYAVVPRNAFYSRIDVLANDYDLDNDDLNLSRISTIPENGEAEIMMDRRISYTPFEDFTGYDSFEYAVSDGKEETTSKVNIIVPDNENPIAFIDTSMGMIAVELYEDKVPNTVNNFVDLANDNFYEDLVFHRVIDDFMIQGGGFKTDGTKKESPYGTIDLEINPEVRHLDGTIAMARTSDPNSATSQFYICDGKQSHLDDNYAAFGKVIKEIGMGVVRNIASVDTTQKNGMNDWPVVDVIINSISIEDEFGG
jgi:peptidyl-prolyl cis-trans isomerase B (cyclophilin B)